MLERFTSVTMLDSSTITLPDDVHEQFRGCGGSYGGGVAAMKLQTELDLRSGALAHVEVEPGRSPDGATSRQHARRGQGSLRISDLGYFNVPVFAAIMAAAAHFLSRLQFGTMVLGRDGNSVNLLPGLGKQPGPFVDQSILLRATFGVSLDRLATAPRTSEPPAPKAASRSDEQKRQRAERGTLGVVRLDDLGDQRTRGNVDAERSDRVVPCSLASGVAI
jgi:hypothetical protein